jgi:hypothetical protein
LNNEARQSMLDTLDKLRQWSNEIDAVNNRCLPEGIDRMAAAQRAMGWPDDVSMGDSVALEGRIMTRMAAPYFGTGDRARAKMGSIAMGAACKDTK